MEAASSPGLSPAATSTHSKLRLPATCEPPGEQNPPKQAVWVVCAPRSPRCACFNPTAIVYTLLFKKRNNINSAGYQIFGATGHIGRSLVRAALSHNDKVVAVGWTAENTLPCSSSSSSSNPHSSHLLNLLCDVRLPATISAVYQRTLSTFGRIDIIANCAGYGIISAIEDQTEADIRNQFETNFWGTFHITSLSLPIFRAQEAGGRYLIFSSTAGALGVPGLGPYCATKYAVEGLIESLLYEVDCYNIKATLVEPGHVRLDEPDDTSSAGGGAGFGGEVRPKRYGHFFVKPASKIYAGETAPAGHARRLVRWLNDRQPTSAVKSAELVWQLGHCSFPPLRLLLGSYAVESIRDRLRSIIEEVRRFWSEGQVAAGVDR